MNGSMKTITLDDEAYYRLRAWKREGSDSFSKVVKRIVPKAGTLEAMADFAERRVADKERDQVLEATVNARSPQKADPWN